MKELGNAAKIVILNVVVLCNLSIVNPALQKNSVQSREASKPGGIRNYKKTFYFIGFTKCSQRVNREWFQYFSKFADSCFI